MPPFAVKGGLHDWTAEGSLASDELNKQIFSIPLNKMSEIIKDTGGYHIIRVLERRQAGTTPLSEIQDDIRATVRKNKIAQSQQRVMEDMVDRIPVWSLFPKDTPGAKPLPVSITRRANANKNR